MNVNVKLNENVLVVTLEGELDHHSAAKVRQEADDSINTLRVKHLVFDLAGLTFMDSAGIGVIMGRYNKMKEIGGKVAVAGCNTSVERILSMAGVFTIVNHYENADEAILKVGS